MQTQSSLDLVLEKIKSYAADARRTAPQLIAVSKGQEIDKLTELVQRGWLDFGENYLQELISKTTHLSDPSIRWHFIGQLQSRKIKAIVSVCTSIHSLGSFKHAQLIEKAAESLGKANYPVFIAVNIADEPGKSGVSLDDALPLANKIAEFCPRIQVRGLMAVPPKKFNDLNYQTPPQEYLQLREIASRVGDGKLSLGMSGDLKIAIAAGSDIVRIGTQIFGERI